MQLNVLKTGNAKGRPLILIHGWGADTTFMLPVARMFEDHDIWAIDLPGYGYNSEFKNLSLNFDDSVHSILETIPNNCDVIAWSLGSLYAIRACEIDLTNKIRSLTLVCGTPRFPADLNWIGMPSDIVKRCRTQLTPQRCRRILNFFIRMQSINLTQVCPDYIMMQQLFNTMPLVNFDVLYNGLNVMSFVDEREAFKNLKIKTLLLFGKADRLVPYKTYKSILSLRKCNLHIFRESAHVPFLTQPHEFKLVVKKFIQ